MENEAGNVNEIEDKNGTENKKETEKETGGTVSLTKIIEKDNIFLIISPGKSGGEVKDSKE